MVEGLENPRHQAGFMYVQGFFFTTQRQRAHPKSGICSHFQQLLVLGWQNLTEETKCAFCEIKIVFTVMVVQSE